MQHVVRNILVEYKGSCDNVVLRRKGVDFVHDGVPHDNDGPIKLVPATDINKALAEQLKHSVVNKPPHIKVDFDQQSIVGLFNVEASAVDPFHYFGVACGNFDAFGFAHVFEVFENLDFLIIILLLIKYQSLFCLSELAAHFQVLSVPPFIPKRSISRSHFANNIF